MCHHDKNHVIWLVVGIPTYPFEKSWSEWKSVGMMTFHSIPNCFWKVMSSSHVPVTHHPVYLYLSYGKVHHKNRKCTYWMVELFSLPTVGSGLAEAAGRGMRTARRRWGKAVAQRHLVSSGKILGIFLGKIQGKLRCFFEKIWRKHG